MEEETFAREQETSEVEQVAKQARCEMVTVVMRQEDYQALKEMGGPRPDHVHMALNHYLDTMSKFGWRPVPSGQLRLYENLTTYKCTLLKSLCDDVRCLKGRFDYHTIEAIRLYLR
ncbi:MAG: hypothetical protein HY912_02315 [Desulfomonile tiedjei]|uniref:Uncharacterized protein n=1 Tax=Desulfomonile tiedjei TaxID=2358 RepID=A0A9D6V090_9BACT|nr:hypothetical protein [Desulfomonile tiedjei]